MPPVTTPPDIYTYDQFYRLTTPADHFGRVRDLELLNIDRTLQTHDWAQRLNSPRMMRGAVKKIIEACLAWQSDFRKYYSSQYASFDQPNLLLRDSAVQSLDAKAKQLLDYYERGDDHAIEWPKLPNAGGADDVKVLVTSYKGIVVRAVDASPVDTQGQLRLFAIDTRDSTMWLGLQPVQEILAQHAVLRIATNDGAAAEWAPYVGTIAVTGGRIDLIQNGSRDNYLYSEGGFLWGAIRLIFEYGFDLTSATAVVNRPSKTSNDVAELKTGTEWFSMRYNASHVALQGENAHSTRTTTWKAPGGPNDVMDKTTII